MAEIIDLKTRSQIRSAANSEKAAPDRAFAWTNRLGRYVVSTIGFACCKIGSIGWQTMRAIGRGLHFSVFLLLNIMRRPITLLLNLSGMGCLVGAIIFALIDHSPSNYGFLATLAACSMITFVLSSSYTSLVRALAPRRMISA